MAGEMRGEEGVVVSLQDFKVDLKKRYRYVKGVFHVSLPSLA